MTDIDILLSRLEGRRTDGHSDDMHADAAKAIRDLVARVAELRELLSRCSNECQHLHHGKGEYHEADEACPVSMRIGFVLADGGCPVHSEPGQSHTRATCTCLAGTPGGNLK